MPMETILFPSQICFANHKNFHLVNRENDEGMKEEGKEGMKEEG